jgi:hypothetical protein
VAGGQRQEDDDREHKWDEAKGEQDHDSSGNLASTQSPPAVILPWQSNHVVNQGRGVYAANAVPFPDHSVYSLYSRRSAFRPVSVAWPAEETVRGPAESASVPVQDEAVNM